MSEATAVAEPQLPLPDPRVGRYVIVRVANGNFGIAVHKVREVIGMADITAVPGAPAFVAGVINLRGKVIPVVDLRGIFELVGEPQTERSCILVVRAMLASTEQMVGFVVEEVMEVLHVQSGDLLGPEELGVVPGAISEVIGELGVLDPASYLVGVARVGGTVKLLLDIDEVLNHLDVRRGEAIRAAA